MQVRSEHIIDASEQGPDGLYDYYYAFTAVECREDDLVLHFTVYDGEPGAFCRSLSKDDNRTVLKYHQDGIFRRRIPRSDG